MREERKQLAIGAYRTTLEGGQSEREEKKDAMEEIKDVEKEKENMMEQGRREWESYDYYAPCCFTWLLFPIAWRVQGSDLGCQKVDISICLSFPASFSPNQTSHTLLLST